MPQIQPLLHERQFQFHPVIFPRSPAVSDFPSRGIRLPVHGIQDRILVRDIKCVPVILQVLRHAGLPGIPFRDPPEFLQRGQPRPEHRDCFLQYPLGCLHGEAGKKIGIVIRTHNSVQRPVREHAPHLHLRVCRLHGTQFPEHLLFILRPLLLFPPCKYLADPEQRRIVEVLRQEQVLLHPLMDLRIFIFG